MSDTARIRINTALLIFGLGGFITAFASFTTLRADVRHLSGQVAILITSRDVLLRHEAEIIRIKEDIARLEHRAP
jgi:hypothetical protein